ncbi:MAG: cadherin repeat domain-containing protein, partial [Gammaproteobacteria bacterium]|nr:cadherin repeat domain-containing protein [Gammaproteobacteria bacterium]
DFAINSSTGAITVAQALDYETTSSYSLTVSVSDGTLTGTVTITVTLNNLIDNNPVVTAATFTIAESTAVNGDVGTVVATDPDGDPLDWTITAGNDAGDFAIDSSTGAITVAQALDYETTSSYSLTVEVSDGTNTGSETITVVLDNVNDNNPVVTAATFTIAESATNGTAVGTVAATDLDGDSLAWAITAGNTGTAFAIDSSSGDITVADDTQLDYETTSSYSLTVQVSDGRLT